MNMFKNNGGFTLVELIVVIAILAILAGVAVPMYSGYITKANEAADTQILSAMNTAFAAACIENNVQPDAVSATFEDGALTVDASDDVTAEVAAAIAADFAVYFVEGEYKYYDTFTLTDGNFVGSKAE